MPIGNGGIIGPANVPTITTASGVWSLREQQQAQGRGAWPLAIAPDPYFEYTTLLLPGNGTNGANNNTFLDGSTNNFTITRNGNTTQGTFSPFSQTGWGNYFDGSGDYLSIASNTALDITQGNFTFECWIYRTVSASQEIWNQRINSPSVIGAFLRLNSNNTILFSYAGGSSITSTSTIPLNSWTHLAVTRSSTTVSIFINGNLDATASFANGTYAATNLLIGRDETGAAQYTGYLSNWRLIKGVVVYTGNFTPPSLAPLTNAGSTSAASYPSTTNVNTSFASSATSLLTCQSNRFIDNSTNNFTITKNGETSVVAFSPFNPTLPWIASINGGSGYFDGSGDVLYTPNTGQFAPTGDFTIGFWVYPITLGVQVYLSNYTSNLSTDWSIEITASGTVDVYTNGSTRRIQASAGTLTVGAWFYIALVRSSNIITLYVNGVSKGTYTQSGTFGSATKSIYIGANTSLSAPSNSYISDVILIDGTATTTVPTQPSTAVSGTRLLLNFTNAGIYDATSKNDLETVGNAQISTTQSKWGGSSISFDGTGDWLLIPDQPPQRIGTGNFTVEMWVYRNSSGTYGLAGKGTGTTGWLVSLNSSNQVVFTYGSSTITSTGTVSATTWTHIAVVREGTSTNQTKIYISGSNDGTGTVSTDFNQTNSMYIGADRTGGSAANAYVQDVRITNYARYTANFTPPTTAFPLV